MIFSGQDLINRSGAVFSGDDNNLVARKGLLAVPSENSPGLALVYRIGGFHIPFKIVP